MKALYKSLFFGFALMFGMASCDKEELPPTGPQDNAEKLVAGTYVGDWTRTTVGTDEVLTGTGTITFSVDSEKYSNNVSVMTLTSDGIDIGIDDPKTSVCNISLFSSGEYSFWNQTATNPFGTTFYGKVSADGVVTMNYSKIIKEGRKEIEYQYLFIGKK